MMILNVEFLQPRIYMINIANVANRLAIIVFQKL